MGFDMTSESKRKEAIEQAIKTKEPTVTEKISVITDKSDAVLLYFPVEKNGETIGVAVINLQLNQFFTNVDKLMRSSEVLSYEIRDVTASPSGEVIYNNAVSIQSPVPITKEDTISFGGRTWGITFRAPSDYKVTLYRKILPFAASEGILIIGVLAFL